MKQLLVLVALGLLLVACSATPPMPSSIPEPTRPPSTAVPSPLPPTPSPILPTTFPTSSPRPPIATPQPRMVLVLFFDWNPQDPFNLNGKGLNSRHDEGEPYLGDFTIRYAGVEYRTGQDGNISLPVPANMEKIMFEAPNSNRYPGSKDLKLLNMQFISTLYEPQRVEYGPNFTLELKDEHCKGGSDRLVCEIGFLDGYITSPYKKTNYLYSSPWTFDSGLNLTKDFLEPLANDAMPSPAGGFYRLGTTTSKLIADYANISNPGVPYGYPYLVKDPQLGVVSHMLMDVRNPQGEPVYAPIGGVVCQGNSSSFAICSSGIKVDVNDFRAIPGWKYDLSVKRGQLIGWTDKDTNIAGHSVPFPLIHMGDFEHRDRAFTLWHFPFLTAGQIIGGGAPDAAGKLVLPAREAVIKNYDLIVELPHAVVYAEK